MYIHTITVCKVRIKRLLCKNEFWLYHSWFTTSFRTYFLSSLFVVKWIIYQNLWILSKRGFMYMHISCILNSALYIKQYKIQWTWSFHPKSSFMYPKISWNEVIGLFMCESVHDTKVDHIHAFYTLRDREVLFSMHTPRLTDTKINDLHLYTRNNFFPDLLAIKSGIL